MRATRTDRRALAAGLLVLAGVLAVSVPGGFLTRALMPGASGTVRALVVTAVMTGIVLAVRSRFGSWAALGVNHPRTWSRPALLLMPLLLALSPLVLGVRQLGPPTWLVLVLGYVLTGFTEELVWRGLAQRLLAPLGPARGVLVASACTCSRTCAPPWEPDTPSRSSSVRTSCCSRWEWS